MDRDAVLWRVIGSPAFPFDEPMVRERAGAAYDRAFNPAGVARQVAAILSQPDRTPELATLDVSTLVVHGDADRLVDPSGGKATAAAIAGARLKIIPGMGHDIPPQLFAELVDELVRHLRQGTAASRA
jgi:pimeloyl-ACP methyl ester carboxylesterase